MGETEREIGMEEASPESGGGARATGPAPPRKGKSCMGCLYYSSVLKSRGYNPICVGIPRSIPQVPSYVVDEPEEEAALEGRDLRKFRYGCAGNSMFADNRDGQGGESDGKTLLPYCRGLQAFGCNWLVHSSSILTKVRNIRAAIGRKIGREKTPDS